MAAKMPGRFSFRIKQDELHNLNERSTEVTKESAFRTREMLKLMHECQDAGVNTLQNLYDQGEKLTKAEAGLDATEAELDKAGVRLGNIKRKENLPCCLLPCASCFNKDPNKHKRVIVSDTTSIAKDGNNQKPNFTMDNSGTSFSTDTENGNNRVQPDLNTKINISAAESKNLERFFPKTIDTPAENEIESNLSLVSHHLGHLKNVATDMNLETGKQNEQIDRMNVKASRNLTKLGSVTKNTIDLVNGDKPPSRSCCCGIL